MRKILILGSGCANCKSLAADVKTAVAELELECEIDEVTDIDRTVSFGVMLTPALVVDGEVMVAGKRPTMEELRKMLV